MGLLSILEKGLKAMVDEAMTPESFKMGRDFEEYVRERIFISKYYDLLEKTHDYSTNSHDYVQSSIKPDFKFRDRLERREFYVEAKFRTRIYDGKIVWCNNDQLRRYRKYNRESPVFLILGMGENPKYPEFITLMPLSEAKYTGLFPSYAKQYEINVDEPVTSRVLWDR